MVTAALWVVFGIAVLVFGLTAVDGMGATLLRIISVIDGLDLFNALADYAAITAQVQAIVSGIKIMLVGVMGLVFLSQIPQAYMGWLLAKKRS
jgi:hypothetical protein